MADSSSSPSSSPTTAASAAPTAPAYLHAQGGALPILALVAVGLLWSIAGVLIKQVAWPPLAIWSVRSAVAALAMLAVRRVSWRDLHRVEWGAGISLALTTALFVAANKYTTAANAILIQYSAPAWVAILGALWLGERATRFDWATIAVALSGIALFFFDQLTFDHTTGNLFALTAGVTFAMHAAAVRRLAQLGRSPLRAILLGHLIPAVIGAPFVVTAVAAEPLPAQAWIILVVLGVFQQAVPSLIYSWAIQRATALEGLLVPILEPILSPCWVWLFLGEEPGRWALAGGCVVVGAVTLRALVGLRREKQLPGSPPPVPGST